MFALELITSLTLGLNATLVWRKDFGTARSDAMVLAASLVMLWRSDVGALFSILVALACFFERPRTMRSVRNHWRMFGLVAAFWFTCRQGRLVAHFWSLSAVTVQLLRRPEWLKLYLRELRIASGPVFTSAAILIFYQALTQATALGRLFALAGMCCVIFGSMLMRPDNCAEDRVIANFPARIAHRWPCERTLGNRSMQTRGKWHGIAMVSSTFLLAPIALLQDALPLAVGYCLLVAMEMSRRLNQYVGARCVGESKPRHYADMFCPYHAVTTVSF